MKLPKIKFPSRPKKLQATTAARRNPAAENYYDEEPKTNLSSAFIVVLVLHIVAVGGIYAFNSIRASRPPRESKNVAPVANSVGTPLAPKATPAPEPVVAKPAPAKSAPAPVSKLNVYHVIAGDTLTKIAAMNGVSVADLAEINGLKTGALLQPNQTLNLPAVKSAAKPAALPVVQDLRKAAFLAAKTEEPPKVAATASTKGTTYIVAKDETPTSIAKKFNTTAAEILKLNNIEDPKKVRVGQLLKIPAKKN